MSTIIDLVLHIIVKLFDKLKKKSKSILWQNMVLVNPKILKMEILLQIVEKLNNQKIEVPQTLLDELAKLKKEMEGLENGGIENKENN